MSLPITDTALHAACILFGLEIFASSLWSASRLDSLAATVFFVGFFAFYNVAAANLEVEERCVLSRFSQAVYWGVWAGAIYLIIELVSGSFIERMLFTYLPFTRPASSSHIGMVGGKVAFIAPDELNRSLTIFNLVLWPAVCAASQHIIVKKSIAPLALLALAALATFMSAHETSKIAIVLSTAVYLMFLVSPKVSRGLVVMGWLSAALLIVPLAAGAYRSNLHLAQWIPENGRARITIWAATIEKMGDHPWVGVGANATAQIDRASTDVEVRPGHAFPWRTGMHAHNIYLQTWYELGAVGALLLSMIGLALLRLISALPDAEQPFALATFVSAATIGAFGFGMWQEWLMAGCFFSAIFTLLGVKLADSTRRMASPP